MGNQQLIINLYTYMGKTMSRIYDA